ncbi:MAG: kynureninase [Bacteroidota bacterium]
MTPQNTQIFAESLDKLDPLKQFRDRFHIPQQNGKDKIYFTGNSLGLQPKTASQYVQQELDDWATLGGEGHFEARRPWFPYHEIFPQQLSKIIGCLPEEVVVMNSLTVNLHLLLVSFYRPTQKRYKIICEYKAFPSDQYVFESQVKYHGFDPATAIIEVKPREGQQAIRLEDIINIIQEHGDSIALVLIGGVNYYTGQVFEMKKITEAAHSAGAYAGFDLAHAAGNIELKMHDWNVDFACWCTYKYLNSGPGSVGGAYIHQRHAGNKDMPRFAGWWGYTKETRFKMEKDFEAIPTAEGWQLSNAPVFSMAAHKAALDIFDEAGIEAIVKKGKQLSEYMIYIMKDINQRLPEKLISIITPTYETERGCQVSFIIKKKGKEVFNHLMENGVSAGWREPEVIRVAPVPLYNSFEDVWRFGQIVENVLQS